MYKISQNFKPIDVKTSEFLLHGHLYCSKLCSNATLLLAKKHSVLLHINVKLLKCFNEIMTNTQHKIYVKFVDILWGWSTDT